MTSICCYKSYYQGRKIKKDQGKNDKIFYVDLYSMCVDVYKKKNFKYCKHK